MTKRGWFLVGIFSFCFLAGAQAQISATNDRVTLTVSSGVTITVAGNLTNNASSTIDESGTIEISGVLSNSGTFNANGTTSFNGSGSQNINVITYHNLTTGGSNIKTLSGNTTINGNLTIGSGTTLDVREGFNYGITLNGNWSSSGSFTPRGGAVTFSGTSNQTITTDGQSFYNVTINNTSTQVQLNDPMTVSNVLTLTDGVITTGANRLIITSTSASAISGHSSATFINGNLRRYIASNTSTYAFPVGNGTGGSNYYRADMINNNLTGITYIDSKFKPLTNHADIDIATYDNWEHGYLDYTTVNTAGVWELEPNAAPTGGYYDVKLYTANMTGLTDNEFGPLKRPVGSTSAADWTTGGGILNNDDGDGRLVAHGYMIRKNLTSFSEYGAGSGNGGGAGLPIELLDFTAKVTGGQVELTWVTATETNNDYFIIEKSNGLEFTVVAIVPGAGNSSTVKYYSEIDTDPFTGLSYYRLVQTDFDGMSTYSQIVSVNINAEISLLISPSPVTEDEFTVQFESKSAWEVIKLSLIDFRGRKIAEQLTNNTDGSSSIVFPLPETVMDGVYFLLVETGEGISTEKVIVNR